MRVYLQFGGKDPSCGLDCSGLVQNVFKADPDNNIGLRLSAAGQAGAFRKPRRVQHRPERCQPGDAIFFQDDNGNIVYTGVVVDVKDGDIYFVHAPHTGSNVKRSFIKIKHPYHGKQKFAGVGRPIEKNSSAQHPAPGLLDRARQMFYSWFSVSGSFSGSGSKAERGAQPTEADWSSLPQEARWWRLCLK